MDGQRKPDPNLGWLSTQPDPKNSNCKFPTQVQIRLSEVKFG